MAGLDDPQELEVRSLQPHGRLSRVTLNRGQVHDERSLLALRVNGAELSLDHGYPARTIGPALPGVHCTKWVGELRFT
jgi:DMSO/TMAO reductase YedYZ molybdopterin-dependent catalytic subunit